jgi:hypothetical protein
MVFGLSGHMIGGDAHENIRGFVFNDILRIAYHCDNPSLQIARK